LKRDAWLYAIALVAGAAVWILVSRATGRAEAWDSDAYFSLGIPVVCFTALLLGIVQPFHAWRWGVMPSVGQLVALLVSQGVGNLLPLGVFVFAILAVPAVLAARAGASIQRKWLSHRKS